MSESNFALEQLSERRAVLPAERPYYGYELREIRPDAQGRRRWEGHLTIYEARGGLNRQAGDFDRDFDRTAEGTLDVRFERTGVLPLKMYSQATPDPAALSRGMYWANWQGELFIIANTLFHEDQTSDNEIEAVALTGDPSTFTCCVPLIFGGEGTDYKLVLGRAGDVPVALTATDGTLHSGTPHADWGSLWCAIQTFTNDNMILLVSGAAADCKIRTVRQTVDWDVAPVDVADETPMRAGTTALGLFLLGGGLGYVRAYWREPMVANGANAAGLGTNRPRFFEVVSTDVQGNDKQPFSFRPQLGDLLFAEFLEDGIAASDGQRVVFKNGRVIEDFGIFNDAAPYTVESDGSLTSHTYEVQGGWVKDDVLKILVIRTSGHAVNGASTHWTVWDFDHASYAWQQTATWTEIDADDLDELVGLSHGSLPWGESSRYLHHYLYGTWYRQDVTPPGVNTFSQRFRKEFESSAYWVSPRFTLPGAEGKSIYVTGIDFLGDLEAGIVLGTPANVQVTAGGVSRKFHANTRQANRVRTEVIDIDPEAASDGLQVRLDVTQDSGDAASTFTTPNVFPIRVHFLAVDNYPPRTFDRDLPALPRRETLR